MNIKGHDIEFIEDIHKYVVDGILLPSVTQILNTRFGHKYDNVASMQLQSEELQFIRLSKNMKSRASRLMMLN